MDPPRSFAPVDRQLVAAAVLGPVLNRIAGGDPSWALAIAAIGWFLAGLVVLRVREA